MDNVLYISMTGAVEIMQAQTIHANNLANVSTHGFQADLAQARAMQVYGDGLPARVYVGTESPATNLSPGSLSETGRSLDIGISGQGYLAVQLADGSEAYTRAGDLHVDSLGQLLTGSGHLVLGDGGHQVRVLPHTDARFAYWDRHHRRDVWRSCRRGEHRSICSHFYLNHHGERIFLD